MKSKSTIMAALLGLTQACWMIEPAQAEPGEHGRREKNERQNRQEHRQDRSSERSYGRQREMRMEHAEQRQGMTGHSYSGSVQIGGYFQERHRTLAREYYERPENRGFCPPGLAKKGNGCMPPGQARKWREGYPLPAGVVYYEVPRSMVISLGVPPSGYRYVRVASDILLIAIGTNMVVDAIQDLVH